MPFFSKAISDLTTADLTELLTYGTAETVRMEFKREVPGPEETLKKLSSFANTFGGYLVIGAVAHSSTGRLEALPGVASQNNFKQTIIQRCHEGIWPPIEVVVSEGIPAPDNTGTVCYVIYVPESLSAPHFLNRGKGAWVRTDEYSQRFETRLATYEQLLHLGGRRALAVERRQQLFARALARFDTLIELDYAASPATSGDIGAHMVLAIVPAFPTKKLLDEYALRELLPECRVAWRQVGFPYSRETVTQVDSVLDLRSGHTFGVVEASVWGQLFYACEIEHLAGKDPARAVSGIHLYAFLGHVLVFLEYARTVYRRFGYNGPLLVRCRLRRVRGKRFMYFPMGNVPELGPSSRVDDDVDVELSLMGTRLDASRDEVAADLFKLLFFALNWAERARDDGLIRDLLGKAAYYNFWREEEP